MIGLMVAYTMELCKSRALNLLFSVDRLIWCPWYILKILIFQCT